ncbi:MAG: LEA type 2 family protein [Gemmatimonadota bacterium]
MRWTSVSSLVLVALILTLSACGRAFTEPEVRLEGVQLAGLGLRGGTLMVNVEITNPNRFALNADQLHYQLAIADSEVAGDTAWVDLASGTYEEPFSVGGGETGRVQVPVEFTYAGLGGAAASILRAGTFNYRAAGTVDVRTPLGTRAVPFRRGGMVTVLGTR